ncbi:hypothetical protein MUO65_05355, partial [bacterium]|nr:hypothetical protein [bacterium]
MIKEIKRKTVIIALMIGLIVILGCATVPKGERQSMQVEAEKQTQEEFSTYESKNFIISYPAGWEIPILTPDFSDKEKYTRYYESFTNFTNLDCIVSPARPESPDAASIEFYGRFANSISLPEAKIMVVSCVDSVSSPMEGVIVVVTENVPIPRNVGEYITSDGVRIVVTEDVLRRNEHEY